MSNSTRVTNLYPHSPSSFGMQQTFSPLPWTHKSSVKGKHIDHIISTSVTLYPILVVVHQVAHLNSHKAKPHQPLCSYYHTASKAYCSLASQDIIQILCSICPTSPAFLCQTSVCGVPLTTYQQCYGIFLLQGLCPTHQACWPLAF
jgi:hypothetical protein